jgi:replicative DNA helicase
VNDKPLTAEAVNQLRRCSEPRIKRLIATIDQMAAAQSIPALAACDVDCERAMLATVWLAKDFLMLMRLDEADFASPFHQWLYRHLRALVDDEEPLDMVALQQRLKKPGAFEGLSASDQDGHRAAIGDLLSAWAPPANVEYYFRVLRTERLKRAVGRLADSMRDRIEKRQHNPAAVLEWAAEQINRLLRKVPPRKAPDAESGARSAHLTADGEKEALRAEAAT